MFISINEIIVRIVARLLDYLAQRVTPDGQTNECLRPKSYRLPDKHLFIVVFEARVQVESKFVEQCLALGFSQRSAIPLQYLEAHDAGACIVDIRHYLERISLCQTAHDNLSPPRNSC